MVQVILVCFKGFLGFWSQTTGQIEHKKAIPHLVFSLSIKFVHIPCCYLNHCSYYRAELQIQLKWGFRLIALVFCQWSTYNHIEQAAQILCFNKIELLNARWLPKESRICGFCFLYWKNQNQLSLYKRISFNFPNPIFPLLRM